MNNNKKIAEWLNLFQNGLNPDQVIELPILSGSMMPVLILGNKIKIKSKPIKNINIGDIIVFKENVYLTGHRVLLKIPVFKSRFFYQKGDNNRFGTWIKDKNILGIVSHSQNNSMEYVDLTTKAEKRKARSIAYKQILYVIYNMLLYYPKKLKKWFI